jgi:hypothetical protein
VAKKLVYLFQNLRAIDACNAIDAREVHLPSNMRGAVCDGASGSEDEPDDSAVSEGEK